MVIEFSAHLHKERLVDGASTEGSAEANSTFLEFFGRHKCIKCSKKFVAPARLQMGNSWSEKKTPFCQGMGTIFNNMGVLRTKQTAAKIQLE